MKNHVLAVSLLSVISLAACTVTQKTAIQAGDHSSGAAMMQDDDTIRDDDMMDESHLKGAVMVDGKMMTIWDDDSTETMHEDMMLKTGMVIRMDGSVTSAAGSTLRLQNGQAMMLDGTIVNAVDLQLKGMMMKAEGDSMMKDEATPKEGLMMASGEYKDNTASNLSLSVLADGKTKVLFFHAAWCPACKTANQTLTSWYASGEGMLTIYKINYDTERALKQKYGVVTQHTFVKIDGNGNVIKLVIGPSDAALKLFLQV